MNNTLSKVFIFVAGAAVGSVVTWKLVKTKYEQIANEEIESIREFYAESDEAEDEFDDEDLDDEEDDREEYENVIKNAGYRNEPDKDVKEEDDEMIEPYVIVPEEFDENGYETDSLVYYADGVVAYFDTNERLDDDEIERLIGKDSLNHFGEYEEDSVFVRNDMLETDFEILKDQSKYSEDN